jgi:hypothetical protein
MIEKELVLTGSDAELLSRALAEVKPRVYAESETSSDDTQALDAIVSCFRTMEKEEQEKETRRAYLSPAGDEVRYTPPTFSQLDHGPLDSHLCHKTPSVPSAKTSRRWVPALAAGERVHDPFLHLASGASDVRLRDNR